MLRCQGRFYAYGIFGLVDHTLANDGEVQERHLVTGRQDQPPECIGSANSTQAADPDREMCQGLADNETRLFIIKPAINLPLLAADQVDSSKDGSRVTACYTRGNGRNEHNLLNCDSAIFLVNNNKPETKAMNAGDVCPIFPQHSTLRMTCDSSATCSSRFGNWHANISTVRRNCCAISSITVRQERSSLKKSRGFRESKGCRASGEPVLRSAE